MLNWSDLIFGMFQWSVFLLFTGTIIRIIFKFLVKDILFFFWHL